jgi:hypothetical protein
MTDRFQISIRHQVKSFEKGLITFLLALIGAILFGVFDLDDFPLFVLTCFLFSIPACYLHITYLTANWGTILTVDKNKQEFVVRIRQQDFNYKYEEVESSELNLGVYYKNELDKRTRWAAPWSNYGYLKVNLKDGNEFIFTSMMLNLNKLPLRKTSTKFRLIPYIIQENLIQRQRRTEDKVE